MRWSRVEDETLRRMYAGGATPIEDRFSARPHGGRAGRASQAARHHAAPAPGAVVGQGGRAARCRRGSGSPGIGLGRASGSFDLAGPHPTPEARRRQACRAALHVGGGQGAPRLLRARRRPQLARTSARALCRRASTARPAAGALSPQAAAPLERLGGCGHPRRVHERHALHADRPRPSSSQCRQHRGRARKLGLATYARRWTSADDRRLRALAARGATIEQAAQQLGRTPEALRMRARRAGIMPPRSRSSSRSRRRWTFEEDELLRLHRALNPARLAELLGRSDGAVCRRLCALGLREGARRSPHHPRRDGRANPLPASAQYSTPSSHEQHPADAKPSPIASATRHAT